PDAADVRRRAEEDHGRCSGVREPPQDPVREGHRIADTEFAGSAGAGVVGEELHAGGQTRKKNQKPETRRGYALYFWFLVSGLFFWFLVCPTALAIALQSTSPSPDHRTPAPVRTRPPHMLSPRSSARACSRPGMTPANRAPGGGRAAPCSW